MALVQIKRTPTDSGRDFKLIDESTFDPSVHELYEAAEATQEADTDNPTDPETGNYAVQNGQWFSFYGPDGDALDHKSVRKGGLDEAFAALRSE